MKEKCIVTGNAGFIGSHITDELIIKGYDVIGFDDLSTGNKDNIDESVEFYLTDIGNENFVDLYSHLF